MEEGLPAAEVSHVALEKGEQRARPHVSRREEMIEILEAVLLALVAIASAWCGYQSARWEGRHAHEADLSTIDLQHATQASTLAGQLRLYDATVFSFWLQAHALGQKDV
jgi:hypothetical protein